MQRHWIYLPVALSCYHRVWFQYHKVSVCQVHAGTGDVSELTRCWDCCCLRCVNVSTVLRSVVVLFVEIVVLGEMISLPQFSSCAAAVVQSEWDGCSVRCFPPRRLLIQHLHHMENNTHTVSRNFRLSNVFSFCFKQSHVWYSGRDILFLKWPGFDRCRRDPDISRSVSDRVHVVLPLNPCTCLYCSLGAVLRITKALRVLAAPVN